ncbi:MAG: hypothetical protein N2322_08205, partial [Terrimicrobiaceae bacterium]|nr:hypothetical protein [Terrimicrobiaceae bacterium]
LAMAAAGLSAAGAFVNPLTAWPSKDINTWLLGVWEHRDDQGKLLGRVTVLPRTGGTYWVNAERLAPRKESARFTAWISRVGPASFLTLECLEGAGELGAGEHVFVHYQVLDQAHVRLRMPVLEAAADSAGYKLRKEVRRRWKAGNLFAEPGTNWRRVSEVYWSGTNENQPFQTPRFPMSEGR